MVVLFVGGALIAGSLFNKIEWPLLAAIVVAGLGSLVAAIDVTVNDGHVALGVSTTQTMFSLLISALSSVVVVYLFTHYPAPEEVHGALNKYNDGKS